MSSAGFERAIMENAEERHYRISDYQKTFRINLALKESGVSRIVLIILSGSQHEL